MDPNDAKEAVTDALRRFDTVMVATRTKSGAVHARPMMIAEVDDSGEVWFVTPNKSDKLDEIAADPTAVVTGQDSRCYVSLSGTLDVIHDPERAKALYGPDWARWLPEGYDENELTILRLRPGLGEVWREGAWQGVRHVFDPAHALPDTASEPGRPHANMRL